ncbi:unnamed protein product, partial [Vitis vinifera]
MESAAVRNNLEIPITARRIRTSNITSLSQTREMEIAGFLQTTNLYLKQNFKTVQGEGKEGWVVTWPLDFPQPIITSCNKTKISHPKKGIKASYYEHVKLQNVNENYRLTTIPFLEQYL